jgi:creatinine amidohydrolase
MMLRIAPHLVGDLTQVEAVPPGLGFEPATRGWITKDRSAAGHIGNPRLATAEKGEVLFRVFSDDVVAFLERVAAWDGKGWDA